MKKVVIYIYGETYEAMANAAEHAADMLRLNSPSENAEWEDRSRVDYTVQEDATEEYRETYGEE